MRPLPCLCSQYASIPHPARPPASSPAPRGGGSRGDTQGKAVSGRVDPCAGSLFSPSPYTGPWEVSPRGVGQTGRGQKPPPLSLLSICWLLSPQAEGHQRSQRITPRGSLISICQHPPPRPASGLLPRPKGRGQSWRYPGKAVSGRVNPCASSLFRLAPYTGPWEASPRGEGQTGRGQKASSPVSAFNMPTSPTPGRGAPEKPEDHPPRISALNISASPTPPGLWPPPPAPGGPRAVVAIPGERPYPGRIPITGPWEASPRGEGQTGRGQKAPSPVSAFNVLASCSQYASIPHPARPPASSPAPRGGGSRGDTRGRPYPGRIPMHWTVGGIPTGGGADGEGACAPSPVSALNMPASPTPPHPGRAEGSRGDTRGKPYLGE
jgi:hypothetical protein